MVNIDMSHYLYRLIYATTKDLFDKNEEYGTDEDTVGSKRKLNRHYMMHILMRGLLSRARVFGCSVTNPLIVALDDSPTWRHIWFEKNRHNIDVYKERSYKQGRDKNDDYPWPDIFSAYNECMDILDKYSDFIVLRCKEAEGDDVIAITTRHYAAKGEPVFIAGSDKDFKQLQQEGVHIYDPMTNKYCPPINTDFQLQTLIIAGDRGDGCLPIKKGVAQKTAEKIYKAGIETFLKTEKGAREIYEFNRTLIDFNYIPADVKNGIISDLTEKKHMNFNSTELMKFFVKYGLKDIAAQMNNFKMNTPVIKTKLNTPQQEKKKSHDAMMNSNLEDFFS